MGVTIARKITVAFVVAVSMLAGVGLVSYRNTRELATASAELNVGRQVLRLLASAVGGLERQLAGATAWGATGDSLGLRLTVEGRSQVDSALRALPRGTGWAGLPQVAAAIDSASSGIATFAAWPGPAALPGEATQRVLTASARADSLLRRIDASLASRAYHAAAVARGGDALLRVALAAFVVLVPVAFLVMRRELRHRESAEEALLLSEARFRAAADGGLDAFYVLRALRDARGEVLDFEFVDLNRKAEVLLGRSRRDVLGQRLCELIPSNRSNGFLEKYVKVMAVGRVLEEDIEITTPQVRAAWVRHQIVPLGDGVAITSRDITERKQQEEALRALSLVDELTGLYNRRGFLTLAQQQLKIAKRGSRELLLLFVDMDDFKEINDTHGHQEGDIALTRAAGILRRTFRDSDILARLGGDEFVVLAADIAHGTSEVIVQRLRNELHERNEEDGFPYRLSFSVGMASFDPARTPSIEELLATADAMLYEQKKHKQAPASAAS